MDNRWITESFLLTIMKNPNVNVKSEDPGSLIKLAKKFADAFNAAYPNPVLAVLDNVEKRIEEIKNMDDTKEVNEPVKQPGEVEVPVVSPVTETPKPEEPVAA